MKPGAAVELELFCVTEVRGVEAVDVIFIMAAFWKTNIHEAGVDPRTPRKRWPDEEAIGLMSDLCHHSAAAPGGGGRYYTERVPSGWGR